VVNEFLVDYDAQTHKPPVEIDKVDFQHRGDLVDAQPTIHQAGKHHLIVREPPLCSFRDLTPRIRLSSCKTNEGEISNERYHRRTYTY
jgi:hypothetical protein